VPSHSGLLSAVDPRTATVVWQYKLSNGMINPPLLRKNNIIFSTMDGKIVSLIF
jgi:outer membrane protein assembly factor BamB